MGSGLFVLLTTLTGFTLAKMDVSIFTWNFWVIIGCMCGAYVCGIIEGKDKEK